MPGSADSRVSDSSIEVIEVPDGASYRGRVREAMRALKDLEPIEPSVSASEMLATVRSSERG